MSIITKPSTIYKNANANFVLNKADLAQHPLVSSDLYFSDTQNWKWVKLLYSSEGNQFSVVEFITNVSVPIGIFRVSGYARDVFSVDKIIIFDFDGGSLEIPRSQLVASEFDIDFSVPVNYFTSLTRTFNSPLNTISGFLEEVSSGPNSSIEYVSQDQVLRVQTGQGDIVEVGTLWAASSIDYTFETGTYSCEVDYQNCSNIFGMYFTMDGNNYYQIQQTSIGSGTAYFSINLSSVSLQDFTIQILSENTAIDISEIRINRL